MTARSVTYKLDTRSGPVYRTTAVNSVDIQSDESTEDGLKRLIIEELSESLELIEMSGPNGIEEFPLTQKEEERFRK